MKTPTDPRHRLRTAKVQSLFAHSFAGSPPTDIAGIISHLDKIDEKIQKSAPEWPLDKINRIDLAIMRVAVHELLFDTSVPPKVVVDEAVEIAKTYGGESSPSFVNGVLGNILKEINV
jgi:N utilization substance protein B